MLLSLFAASLLGTGAIVAAARSSAGSISASSMAASDDITFDVDMPSFLARHDLMWDFRWIDDDPHVP